MTSSSPPPERRGWSLAGIGPELVLAAALTLAAFNLFWRLGWADLHFDEPLYGRDGWHSVHGRVPVADHPPFGKLMVGLGQLLVGRNATGIRLFPVLFALSGTLVAWALGRRFSRWTAALAALLWATMPRDLVVAGYSTIDVRIDRYGILDTIASPLQSAAVWAVLRWGDGPTRRRAALVGVLVGLALATKLSSGVVIPVVAAAMVLRGHDRWTTGRGVLTSAAAALVAFVVPFAPFGRDAPEYLRTGFDFQMEHAGQGHVQVLGDQVYLREPWWANMSLWWAADGLMVVVLVVTALAAWRHRDRFAVATLWGLALVIFGALALSRVALAHYHVQWMGPLLILAAAGITGLWRIDSRDPLARSLARGLAVVVAVTFLWSGVKSTWSVATLERGPYQQMAADVRATGRVPEHAITFGTDLGPYLPGTNSTYGGFVGPQHPFDVLVIERQFYVAQLDASTVEALRSRARDRGMVRVLADDVEYWFSP